MSGDKGGSANFSDGALGMEVMADSGKVSVEEVAAGDSEGLSVP